MAFALDTYTGNNSTTSFSVTFPYIEQAHVIVTVDGTTKTLNTDYTFSNSATITFTTAPALNAVIKFTRKSNQTARLVDYQDGSTLTEATLDQDGNQTFFMAQEAIDITENSLNKNASDLWDADNKRIINVATPTGSNDSANKAYVDAVAGSATAAAASETAAANSATAAQNAQNAAEAALDTFDDDILGSKSSDPSVDNDGNALTDGALYYNTTDNRIKVYDLGTTSWYFIAPTSTEQTKINNVSDNMSAVTSVNTNLSGINSFAERYRVQAGVPSSSNDVGDLVFDTTANKLKVFDGSSYALAGSSVNGTSQRFKYNATANQTTFSGADANGNTLTYDVASGTAFADIYLNGVKLDVTDFTATTGTSIVLASGASVNDILQVVAYGTFNLASFSAANITSGSINNARLPSTISDKTIEATALTAKGDGSSADGKITLNCSQNSHGVAIQSPAHSASQSYTLILPTSVGTNGQVLATNGSSTNQLSWIDATETKPTVANVSQTIAPATATTITITGTNFVSIPQVDFVNGSTGAVTRANTVSFTNATTLSVNCTLATGNYYVRIENPDCIAGRSTNNIITASTAPTFSTNAGSLGTFAGNFSGNIATIAGSSDSAVTFSEVGSNLATANVTLSSAGVLATTDFGGSSTTATQYNFTVRITDAEGQTADRAFSLTSSFGATGGGQFN